MPATLIDSSALMHRLQTRKMKLLIDKDNLDILEPSATYDHKIEEIDNLQDEINHLIRHAETYRESTLKQKFESECG